MPVRRFTVDEWRPWPLLTAQQIENSPSFKLGMSFKTEKKLRLAGCRIIGEAGKTLDQGIMTIAVGQAYFMRFFGVKPYQRNDSFVIAVAALFVASKTENRPRALADIAHACWRQWVDLWAKEQKKKRKDQPASYWDQKAAAEKNQFRDPEWYKRLGEAALTAERVLLYTTGFQFTCLTGFNCLLGCKTWLIEHPDRVVASFFNNDKFLQVVWNFVIECYRSTRLCLQYDPRTIGIACYEMTCSRLERQIPLVNGDTWWKYVARKANWDLGVGNPNDIRAVQAEVGQFFQDAKKPVNPAANGAPTKTEGSGSQPGTPALTAGSRTPGASPGLTPAQQPIASTSGRPASANGAGHLNGRAAPPPSATMPPEAPPPLPMSAVPGPQSSPSLLGQSPLAEVKQKSGESSLRFSPSDEFTASPRASAPDDSAQTRMHTMLGTLESGELPLDPSLLKPAAKDPALLRARLEKARALAGKRKAEDSLATGEPRAKQRQVQHSVGLGSEFEA